MPAQGLVRPRLTALLDAARPAALALVVAPAGFGKTTVLRHYAASHCGPVAWYSVDAQDAAAGRATERLAQAVRAASGSADGLLLIIDDADGLTGTPDETLIDRFLAQRPPDTHVVLAGRRMPVLNLLRHEVFAVPGVVGPDQLRFREWEVERLLATVYAEPLPVEDVALLARRTGGWAAGLAMFHLSTRGRPLAARQRAVAALSGRWSIARDYLARTLLDALTGDLRDFVIATSVLDVLTGPRCDALLDRTGSDRVLERLAQRYGLPMSADGGETYHYHQVLRSHLRTALVDSVGEAEAAQLHVRAARLLADEGASAEAVRAHARAGDLTAVRCQLARYGGELIQPGADPLQDVLPGWLLAEDPWLVYAQAREHLGNGQLRAALRGFRTAEAIFHDDDLGDAARDEGLHRCQVGQQVARTWLGEGPDDRTHWSAWLRAAVQRYPAAVAGEATALPGPGGELVRLVADLLAGNLREPLAQATAAKDEVRADGSVAAIGIALLRAALRLAAAGTAGAPRPSGAAGLDALVRLDSIADEADAAGVTWLSRMARAARVLNGHPTTATDAYDVAAECERHGDAWGHALATLLGCLSDWRHGRPDTERLARVADECGQLGASVLQAWARALQVLAGVCDDVPDAEDEAMAAADFAARAGVPGARVAATVAVARLDPIRRARLLDGALAEARTIGLPDNVLAGWGAAPAPTPASTVDRVPPVWIRCFGGFRMEVDGRPVQLSTVRARARSALRLLAMQTGQVVHREILIEALWPDLPPPAATRNLQVSISALRGLLEPESVRGKAHLLIRSGDAYGIALPPGGYADTTAFTEAVQRWKRIRRAGCSADGELQAMREALAAYGGELLPEDGPADWAVLAREHFRLQATQVARALAVAEIDGGNRSDAIATAEFCLTLDPHDDEAWRVLVRAYSDGGAPAKAVEVRRRYAEMLASLGLPAATPAYRAVSPVRTLPAQQSLPAGRAVGRRRT